jgi:2-oxoglutarate ferredoxin oxidoreductase subunit alpha
VVPVIKNDIAVMIGGRAGDGSLVTGEILAKIFREMGLEVFTVKDFPSNIRGLPTNYTIRAKDRPIMARKDHVDILLALDKEAVSLHGDELPEDGVLIYDNSDGSGPEAWDRDDVHLYKVPMRKLAVENLGGSRAEIFKNTISLGVLAHLLSIDEEVVQGVTAKEFSRKGTDIVERNRQAISLGLEYAREHLEKRDPYVLERRERSNKLLVMGDWAIGYGALVAGCRFYAGYPITPATEIMEWLAAHMPRYNGLVVQAEDEISAVMMAIGAAYTGLRAMTGTSGPGASLMTEAVSLAGMSETPLVLVHGQRAGPATGLPTKTEQSDLTHALFASHGDFPRIVLSPGSVEEAFYLTVEAFNLAEMFQCPVILLTEQAICQNKQTVPRFDLSRVRVDRGKLLTQAVVAEVAADGGTFKRYSLEEDGVSPRPIPSLEGMVYEATGNEHDEEGYTTEDPALRSAMMEKRMRKLETAKPHLPPPVLHGEPDASLALVAFGYTTGAVLEAMEVLRSEGITTRFVQLRTLWPFQSEDVAALLEGVDRIFVVEHNYSGQLSFLLPSLVEGSWKMSTIRKYDGKLFTAGEIVRGVKEVV